MPGRQLTLIIPLLAFVGVAGCGGEASPSEQPRASSPTPGITAHVSLPQPRLRGPVSLEEAIARRRSVRDFADRPVSRAEVAQLLWAAQGVTDAGTGYRAAPSAGALYPLELFLVAERVTGLTAGVYHYEANDHALAVVRTSSATAELYRAALSQPAVRDAPAVLVVAAVFARTTGKYGARGRQYVFMEAGHAAQNIYLQAVALGLGTVAIGAFDDGAVRQAVGLRQMEQPLYIMPCGQASTD